MRYGACYCLHAWKGRIDVQYLSGKKSVGIKQILAALKSQLSPHGYNPSGVVERAPSGIDDSQDEDGDEEADEMEKREM